MEPSAVRTLHLDFRSTFSLSISPACTGLSREGRTDGGLPPGLSADLLTSELVSNVEGVYRA